MQKSPKKRIDHPDSGPKPPRELDAISSVLSLLDPQAPFAASLTTGGEWSFHFPRFDGLEFAAILEGSCWIAIEGMPAPLELGPGDCFLLPATRSYRMASSLDLKPVDADAVFGRVPHGKVQYGPGGATVILGARFTFDRSQASILLDSLPPLVVIRANSGPASKIPLLLDQFAEELASAESGSALMVDHLAHMLFVRALRAYLALGESLHVGWLGALANPQIARALNGIHRLPGRRWTLRELTAEAGMSRSVFCLRFKQLVGAAPLDYLLNWRMQLAAKDLRTTTKTLAEIAYSLGYESESAFAHAFKRVMGSAPRQYRNTNHDS